jgi:CheY-like chemotaxis protein
MSAAGDRQASRRLDGSRILVVEDESIISLLIEDMLIQLGCAAVWQASRVESALALLERQRPDAALLDINLAGEPAYPVAERLQAAQIPFVFATGYGWHGLSPAWSGRPVIQKPFRLATLADMLGTLMAR